MLCILTLKLQQTGASFALHSSHEQTSAKMVGRCPLVLTSCPGSLTAQSVLSSPQQWHVKESCFPSPIVTRLSSWTLSAAATAPAASAVSGRLLPAVGARQVAEVTPDAGAAAGGSWPSTLEKPEGSAVVPRIFGSTAMSSASMSSSSPSRFRLPLPGGAGALAFVGDISCGRDHHQEQQQHHPTSQALVCEVFECICPLYGRAQGILLPDSDCAPSHPIVNQVVHPPEVESTGSSDTELVGIGRVEAEERHVPRKNSFHNLAQEL